ncbi:hypothetical protein [Verrucomicrobium sp. BvORR106]|uniref:hypothetical protein n=1 Tax=Verrucomicrobium sp. BvORR106 TaxID=1403819 RepID=UPI00056E88E8|nr:hypothetical protein [Verrucomicrobium sp. BvORR106]
MCLLINDPELQPQSQPQPQPVPWFKPGLGFEMLLKSLPGVPELPGCLLANARFETERARLIEAELCLRAATRHAEMARWSDLDAALQLAEQQISLPLQKLLWADERHTEETDAAILSGEEVEAMGYFIGKVVRCRKERRHPDLDAEECEGIRELLQKYAAAIAEKREHCDDATCAEDHDFWHVRQCMLAANSGSSVIR